LVEWGEVAPAAGVDCHSGIEQVAYDVGAAEQGELAEDPAVPAVTVGDAENWRGRVGQPGGFAASDGQYGGIDLVEVGGGAAFGEQVVGGEVAAAGSKREWTAADVPPVPWQVHVGTGVEEHGDDSQAAAAADRMVQAVVPVDVDAAVEEPAEAGGVFEVQLVVDHVLESGPVEQVEEPCAGLFAGVVEGVLVTVGASVEQQPNKVDITPLDGIEERRLAALATPLHGMAVRVGARIEQQPGAVADLCRGPG
jgi:hypothetical protein